MKLDKITKNKNSFIRRPVTPCFILLHIYPFPNACNKL
jgi:hypothetical protein